MSQEVHKWMMSVRDHKSSSIHLALKTTNSISGGLGPTKRERVHIQERMRSREGNGYYQEYLLLILCTYTDPSSMGFMQEWSEKGNSESQEMFISDGYPR